MDAAAEAEVDVVLAGGVEAVGLLEAQGVAVAGGEDEDQGRALGDGDAADLDVGERGALGSICPGGS
ncbi:hypothetical protein GCM10020221_13020 [Streptomyces thioluteus]|uniref:Uncharacterized protein n=1 Tax=Streptomyces thioluteus TaxID=66431 RepID=A0ABP6J2N3_STRTU